MTLDAMDDRTRREYDWRTVSAVTAVLETVEAATGRSIKTLPTLSDSIDPESLELLFDGGSTDLVVSFRYAGYRVTVHGDGWVVAEPAE